MIPLLSTTGPLIRLIEKFLVRSEIGVCACRGFAEAVSRAGQAGAGVAPGAGDTLLCGDLSAEACVRWRKVKTSKSEVMLILADTVNWLGWGFAEEVGQNMGEEGCWC